MTDMCGLCADAGFPNIIAMYKGIPKGMSHDGKARPPMCYYHHLGQVPPHIKRSQTAKSVVYSEPITFDPTPIASTKKSDSPKWTELLNKCSGLKVGEEQRIKLPNDSTINQFRAILRNSKITRDFKWHVTQNYPDTDSYNVKLVGKWDSAEQRLAKEMKEDGLSNKQISDRIGVDAKRVQAATSERAEEDNYEYKPSEKSKHIRKNDILTAPVCSLEEYNTRYGELGKKRLAKTTLEMWKRIEELPLSSVLILPMMEEESTNKARSRYTNLLHRCIKEFKPDFRIRMVGVQEHHHVVLYKSKEKD